MPERSAGRPDPLSSPRAGAAALRGGALRAGAWAVSAALSLVSLPLLVRHLGVEEFGRYVSVLAVVNVAALASDFGLVGLALREWGVRDPAERPGVVRALLGLRLAAAAIGALAAVGFSALAGYPSRLVTGTAIAAVGIFGQVFGDFALVGLAGTMRFGRVALVEVTRAALGTLAIVVVVVAGAGLGWFFAAWSAAALASAAVAMRLSRDSVAFGLTMRPADWRPLLADTAGFAAASAAHVVYFRVVVIVMSIRASARQTGLFATVFRVVEFSAAVAAALSASVTPVLARAARDDPARLRREATRTVWTALAAGAAGALVLGLGAAPLMDLIGAGRADSATVVMRIAAPAVAAGFATFALGAVLLVLRRYRELLTINLAALALALGLALVLVPAHGARGGAIALLAGEWSVAMAQGLALWRALRSPGPAPLPSAERA